MTEVTELETTSETVTAAAVKDRRRPGRLEGVNADLIPILRGEEPVIDFESEEVDQTAALRGLVAGVLFSAPVWIAIAYFGSWLMS